MKSKTIRTGHAGKEGSVWVDERGRDGKRERERERERMTDRVSLSLERWYLPMVMLSSAVITSDSG